MYSYFKITFRFGKPSHFVLRSLHIWLSQGAFHLLGMMLIYVVCKLGTLYLNYIFTLFFSFINSLVVSVFLYVYGGKKVHIGKVSPMSPIYLFFSFILIFKQYYCDNGCCNGCSLITFFEIAF